MADVIEIHQPTVQVVEVLHPGPRGPAGPTGPTGVSTVTASTLAAGAPATATLADGALTFGIPRGDRGDRGPEGQPGARGPVGPAGLTWRGTWDPATDYLEDDAVYWDGSSWFAAGDPPAGDVPAQASAYWNPLAIRGPQGLPGAQGDPGQPGTPGQQGVPGVTSATASALPAGSAPTTSLTGGVLALGIPGGTPGAKGDPGQQGPAGVTSATASPLAAGSAPTASVSAGVLALGIPAGAPGAKGDPGAAAVVISPVRVYSTQQQALNQSTVITFDAESFDVDNWHSTTTNTDRLTCPAGRAGKYLVMGAFDLKDSASFKSISLRKNGATTVEIVSSLSGNHLGMQVFDVMQLAPGDYVQLLAYASTTISQAAFPPSLSLAYLGP